MRSIRYPFLQLAETTLAVNLSGMALRFIELSGIKTNPLDSYRKNFFEHPGSETSHALVKASRDIVNEIYPSLGLSAADKSTEINRVWRNFHTAAQHSLFFTQSALSPRKERQKTLRPLQNLCVLCVKNF
ncbi:MAG: hypothetical protein WDO15_07490 [Bacteroidota bacterium]